VSNGNAAHGSSTSVVEVRLPLARADSQANIIDFNKDNICEVDNWIPSTLGGRSREDYSSKIKLS
jgi:hypothetical protein